MKILIIPFLAFFLLSFDLPFGWFIAGSEPNSYEMGIANGKGRNEGNAATIKSTASKVKGFGTLMQQVEPGKYLGKRIKMTGFVKTENVDRWSGLWLRIDKEGSDEPLSFDNMYDRPIKGTTDWKKYEIELDVPLNASLIAFGALLDGKGQIWFDNIQFEVVSDIKSQMKKSKQTLNQPTNLDFEK